VLAGLADLGSELGGQPVVAVAVAGVPEPLVFLEADDHGRRGAVVGEDGFLAAVPGPADHLAEVLAGIANRHLAHTRPHQSCGGRPPAGRFALADRSLAADDSAAASPPAARPAPGQRPAGVSRWVDARGKISLAGFSYAVGATYAGEPVEVVVAGGLVDILHAGVVVATHVQRLRDDQADRAPRARVARKARDATAGLTVTRLANHDGQVTFAGTTYRAGRMWARAFIDVTIVAGSVQLSKDGKVIRVHPIRHDRSREFGGFANPKGRARRKNSAIGYVS